MKNTDEIIKTDERLLKKWWNGWMEGWLDGWMDDGWMNG